VDEFCDNGNELSDSVIGIFLNRWIIISCSEKILYHGSI